jgi:hypothetical protein
VTYVVLRFPHPDCRGALCATVASREVLAPLRNPCQLGACRHVPQAPGFSAAHRQLPSRLPGRCPMPAVSHDSAHAKVDECRAEWEARVRKSCVKAIWLLVSRATRGVATGVCVRTQTLTATSVTLSTSGNATGWSQAPSSTAGFTQGPGERSPDSPRTRSVLGRHQ